jgi:hypothetical protein
MATSIFSIMILSLETGGWGFYWVLYGLATQVSHALVAHTTLAVIFIFV